MALTPIALPGLLDRETGYRLDSGDTVVMTTTRYAHPTDAAWLIFQVDVEQVDPLTMATIAFLVSHPLSVQLAALAGDVTVDQVTAVAHEEAGKRALAAIASTRALGEVHETPEPGVPVTRNRTTG